MDTNLSSQEIFVVRVKIFPHAQALPGLVAAGRGDQEPPTEVDERRRPEHSATLKGT